MGPVQLKKNWLIFLFIPIPFLFYGYTCLHSIGLGDSALFIDEIKNLKLSTYVNNHNLTTLWGWLVQILPTGNIAYKGNLSCVFAGSAAIGIFFIALYLTHRCWLTALISTLFLMISHSMWWHATYLADYGMNTVFVALTLYLYVQLHRTGSVKYLYTLFFLSGLALFQHYLLGSILVGAIAALLWRSFQKKEKAWPLLWKSAILFLIGLIPWMLTFQHDVSISHSISNTISGCLGGPFRTAYFKQPFWNGIVEYSFLIFIQFPSLYLLAVVPGLYFFLRSWKLNESSIGVFFTFLPVIVFELGLDTWAIFAQYLSTFIILAFWASFVVYKIVHHRKIIKSSFLKYLLLSAVILSLGWTPYFYGHLSRWGNDPNSIWFSRYNNSLSYNTYRVNEFLANPNKRGYHDIAEVCNLILAKLPPHAEFCDSDSRLYFQLQLYYQQFYHRRLDVDFYLINSFLFPNWGIDQKTFAQKIKYAYLNGKAFFLNSMGWPESDYLSGLPDRQNYQFEKFRLNDNWWVYKLITLKDKRSIDPTLWHRWDLLPSNKPVLINLTIENVLDFHEGYVLFQQDMVQYGPYWKNDDQIFFKPDKQGSEIGFLLRFNKAFKSTLTIKLTTAFDAGIVEIFLNDIPLAPNPIDLYSLGVYNKAFKFENASFINGNNIITMQVIGKNDRSSSMNLGVDTIEITPESAQN